jgi:glycosyltransferase involved in cell wall biosynthesis
MLNQPYFSVIIATYNRADLLIRAVNSLISQTNKEWEAIIVDDGSTDNTYSKIFPYLRPYPRIRYLRKIHNGSGMSKNAGICSSIGKFVTFLDSDDEYEPEHLDSRMKILTGDPTIRFLHGGTRITGNQFVPDRFDLQKRINLNECVIGGTFFIERSLILRLGGFKRFTLGEDADLFDRAEKNGTEIRKTSLATYIYHHDTEDSITNNLYNETTKQR